MDRTAVACTLTFLHPEPPAPEPALFRSTLEPAHPADVAIALFMAWLGSLPAWMLAWAHLAS